MRTDIVLHLSREEAGLIIDAVRNYRPAGEICTLQELIQNEARMEQEAAQRREAKRVLVNYITETLVTRYWSPDGIAKFAMPSNLPVTR
jgi:hypothetical protein